MTATLTEAPIQTPTTTLTHATNWFEIPTLDLERAAIFYETLLDQPLIRGGGDDPMYLFPSSQEGVGGALVHRPSQQPASSGTMVYLNVDGQLGPALARALVAGATLLMPKTAVPGDHGHFACIRDTEGNHVGLHSH
jgi:predicted enzyme related to lactoylglutathione lyase